MKIAIIGTGGVGGYFGGKLAKAGFDVTFLARGEHLKEILKNGLQVKSIMGDFHIKDCKATDSITHIHQPDVIITGVKAWQIKEIRNDLKNIIHAGSMILPLQNGIMAAEELAEVIEKSHILGGTCRTISKIDTPGVINHFGVIPTIVFGELNRLKTSRTEKIQKIFLEAKIESRISEDIESDLWKKFIGICVGGLLAITKTTYGELRSLKETRGLMIDLLTEIYMLSKKSGVKIEHDFIEKTISAIDTFPYESTTSLSRDIWEGKPSEIEYQNGTVVRLAKKFGIKVPVNQFIYGCILPMELKARS
jgi:2-dehydropantoate 2-reductase